jgi:hypothetical protein
VGLVDPASANPVVADPYQRATEWIHVDAAELGGAETRAAHDRLGVEPVEELGSPVGQQPLDPILLDLHTVDLDLPHQPHHVLVGVDHWRHVGVRVDHAVIGTDAVAFRE